MVAISQVLMSAAVATATATAAAAAAVTANNSSLPPGTGGATTRHDYLAATISSHHVPNATTDAPTIEPQSGPMRQGSNSEFATINYNGVIGYNGTDPYNIIAESRTSSFSLPIQTQMFMCLLYGMLTFVAVTSNVMICYIVLSNTRMRTATNYFIVNLAVGDILMALLCIPFTFPVNLIFQYWPFGLSLCVIVSYSQANSVFISAYTMVAISIDKYLAIMYPMRLRMSKMQAKIIILVIWSAALITSLPTALLSSLEPLSLDSGGNTTYEASSPVWPTSPLLVTQTLTTNSGVPSSWLPPQQQQAAEQQTMASSMRNQASNATNLSDALIDDPKSTSTTTTFPEQQLESNAAATQQQLQGQRKYACQESWNFWPQGKYYYSMALMILQFVLPLFVLVITYSRIVIVVWGKRMPGEEDNARDARMARSKRKMIKMVIFCVIAFALTWLPFNALIVIGDMHPAIWENSYIMYIWFTTHYLAMCHTITNPLIYIWMNNRFRAGFVQVIHDLYMSTKRASVFLWFYCCCLGCCITGSRVKHHRVASSLRQRNSTHQKPTSSCLVTNHITNHNTTNANHLSSHTDNHVPHPAGQAPADFSSSSNGLIGRDRQSQVTVRSAVGYNGTGGNGGGGDCGARIAGAPSRANQSRLQTSASSGANNLAEVMQQQQEAEGEQSCRGELVAASNQRQQAMEKHEKKGGRFSGGRKRRPDTSGAAEKADLEAEVKRAARKKRRERAQSHAINLCLTSAQQPKALACNACHKKAPGSTAASGKKSDGKVKRLGGCGSRPFIADMCQSSQSTATNSVHTNTTSLAISPLNSARCTANNTSASSGEQAVNGGSLAKSEPGACGARAKRVRVADRKLRGESLAKLAGGCCELPASTAGEQVVRMTNGSGGGDDDRSSGDSSTSFNARQDHSSDWARQQQQQQLGCGHLHRNLQQQHLDQVQHQQQHSAAALDLGSGGELDNLETTDDDVGDVIFQQTASLESSATTNTNNNKRDGSSNCDHSDEQVADYCDDDGDDDDYDDDDDEYGDKESLDAEYGERSSPRHELVPMVRIRTGNQHQEQRRRPQRPGDSPRQRRRMQVQKRLFRSMGDDVDRYPGCEDTAGANRTGEQPVDAAGPADDYEVEVVIGSERCCFADRKSHARQRSEQANHNESLWRQHNGCGPSDTSDANANHQPIGCHEPTLAANEIGSCKIGKTTTTTTSNSEQQQQRVRSLRRTMLLNNHLISSTSKMHERPLQRAGSPSSSSSASLSLGEASRALITDVISLNGGGGGRGSPAVSTLAATGSLNMPSAHKGDSPPGSAEVRRPWRGHRQSYGDERARRSADTTVGGNSGCRQNYQSSSAPVSSASDTMALDGIVVSASGDLEPREGQRGGDESAPARLPGQQVRLANGLTKMGECEPRGRRRRRRRKSLDEDDDDYHEDYDDDAGDQDDHEKRGLIYSAMREADNRLAPEDLSSGESRFVGGSNNLTDSGGKLARQVVSNGFGRASDRMVTGARELEGKIRRGLSMDNGCDPFQATDDYGGDDDDDDGEVVAPTSKLLAAADPSWPSGGGGGCSAGCDAGQIVRKSPTVYLINRSQSER